jgi:hypothetical protein
VDTPGLLAAWFDGQQNGNIALTQLLDGGGAAGQLAGLMLSTSYCLWPQSSGGHYYGCGLGDSTAPTTQPASVGTLQASNSAHPTCVMCIDLVDSVAVRWAPLAWNAEVATIAPTGTANADGSGWASRLMAHWASVYSSNGSVVGSLPAPLSNWTNTTPITSSFLNGNTGLRGPLRFLNSPPLARAQATGTQALVATTNTTLNLTASSGFNLYGNFASNTYTVPFNGLYFVHGSAGIGSISGNFKVGVKINGGTTYWGPRSPAPSAGAFTATKTQIFSLNAGDTITLQAQATTAATTGTVAVPRLVVLYVGAKGTPSPLPTVPDTTFLWTAGTPGPVTSALNAHVANDLTFLIQRPYLLAYQTVAQNVPVTSATSINMDTVGGIVHSDAGDNYSGWSNTFSSYAAPRSGWYLCVEEIFFTTPTLTSTPSVVGLIELSVHGTDSFDRYQQQSMVTIADGSGATAVSYYYLRAGDTIKPGVATYDSTATTLATSTVENSHFELVWLGE